MDIREQCSVTGQGENLTQCEWEGLGFSGGNSSAGLQERLKYLQNESPPRFTAAALDGVNKQDLFIVPHCEFCNLTRERSSLILRVPRPPSVNCFFFLMRECWSPSQQSLGRNGHTTCPDHQSDLFIFTYVYQTIYKTIIMQRKTECRGLARTLALFALSTDSAAHLTSVKNIHERKTVFTSTLSLLTQTQHMQSRTKCTRS